MAEYKVRKPAVAGTFYPSDKNSLKYNIEEYIAHAEDKSDERKIVRGIVSPHAGYIYSGPVAGWSFKQVQGKQYDSVIVISPSHMEAFRGSSVFSGDAYHTPLGEVPVDKPLCEKITTLGKTVLLQDAGHQFSMWGRGEHALEVQLPFIQVALQDGFKIVPIVMGQQSENVIEDLAQALSKALKGANFLIVASSDLSHYHSYHEARSMDKHVVDAFNEYRDDELMDGVVSNQMEACGGGPIVSMMKTLKQIGPAQATSLYYATSGDVPVGEKDQVVGYMSGMIELPR